MIVIALVIIGLAAAALYVGDVIVRADDHRRGR